MTLTKTPKIKLSASWYHSKDILPYYFNIDISHKGIDFGYSILINLETLELIEMKKTVKKENSFYSSDIDLDKKCLEQYASRIKALK